MQNELVTTSSLTIQIIGINEAGYEGGNEAMTDGRDLPWLQDTATQNVWDSWNPVYRDVIILDGKNVKVGVYNLTTNRLDEPDNYMALKKMFIDAASP